ncbi:MAG TPA: hypothetical protein VH083_22015 [Myxococcales bacterium]|jgi:hypothetical protein|nr:hypothetical protein [Myxococcales bacterium]
MKKLLAVGGVLVVFILGGLTLAAGPHPRDWWGLVRYALPRMHRGDLKVGDLAPDALLVSLDGESRIPLRGKVSGKPLVLVFGSFT